LAPESSRQKQLRALAADIVLEPPTAFSATDVRYGPRSTEMTVVANAEFATS
jgi:hypothetical protein